MSDIFQTIDQWLAYSFRAPWSALLIYGIFGLASFVLCYEWSRWYKNFQRERSFAIFAIAKFFQGIAFTLAALVTADQPITDFRFLLSWVRPAWLLTLVFYVWGIHTFHWKIEKLLRDRSKRT